MTRASEARTSPRRAAPAAPRLVVVGAAALSVAHLVLGTAWAAGLGGYPFRAAPDDAFRALLAGGSADLVASGIAAVAAAVLLAVVAGSGVSRRGPRATAVVATLALAGLGALLAVPGPRLLAAVAYTPVLLAGAPFGWPEGASLADAWPWPVAYQGLSVAAGLLWVATAMLVARGARGACTRCGRGPTPARWMDGPVAARWGRWAVGVAVAVPLAYAATRYAWALGIPAGISEDVLREGRETGLWVRGALLATLAVAGAGLTLGLCQRWGEVLPGWLPLVGGRPVRPAVATVPAVLVAALVTSAGLAFVRLAAIGAFDDFFAGDSWAVIGPELLWPAWGVALAAAALAYHLRRRGRCPACGAGHAPATSALGR